jgi:hypothetical protein
MSVASINNGSLQLSELVISNEKYSNATGYVASQTVLSSTVSSTALSVPDITASTGLTLGSGSNTCSIQAAAFNTIGIGGDNTGDITCGGISASGDITCVDINASGTIASLSFTVGTGNDVCGLSSTALNTLGVGASSGGTLACGDIDASGTIASLSFTVGSGNDVCGLSSPALNTLGIGASNGGTLVCDVITLNGGSISVNSTNQLCWNGVPIS